MRKFLMPFTTLLCVISLSINAALPPLTQEERETMSTDIVSGYVLSISKTLEDLGNGFSDNHYRVLLLITSVLKGDINLGKTLEFSYRRANTRPDGWVGPGGQYQGVTRYTNITAYMLKDAEGKYSLLEPNGFDVD